MGDYEDGESSANADWIGAIGEAIGDDLDIDLTPSDVAEHILALDREATLLARTLQALGARPLAYSDKLPGDPAMAFRFWAQAHVAAGTDRDVPYDIRRST